MVWMPRYLAFLRGFVVVASRGQADRPGSAGCAAGSAGGD